MKICVLGDSVARGVIYDEARNKYTFLKNSFINLFSSIRQIPVKNLARFGCTTTKGQQILEKHKEQLSLYDYTILEFGGNDCNYNWEEVARTPEKDHAPAVPSSVFKDTYSNMLEQIRSCGSQPILLSLPPLNPQRFFDWVCRGLNRDNVLRWLGDIDYIYRWHEAYNLTVFQLAQEHKAPLIDIRRIFLENRHYGDLLCVDGMHPNEKGHALINSALVDLMI
ncbi:SGNH/GDSL hydrolase family protein [Anaerovorax odorimutans]|uniref:SGNH/GDSL hydrolase family protein n=1 Tax=Anaerovorax odorimutans TaxID=109327 RepID=A0ABT1RRL1_9FIRM|nr:SGNH/GDSL hydrolase family protein [Anaerovorax odorimutans]MCQ4637828.1 SGNH/GDSL hydrolase family protein [Anaerovorax odorimutans]